MIYELVICTAIIGGNCQWKAVEQPSRKQCEAAMAAKLAADKKARRPPPVIIYCRELSWAK
jgi:hypothetical protein